VIWKNPFPVPCRRQVSRLAVSDAVAFPIAQWLLLPDGVNPHTVTSSHRLFTCFPIIRCKAAAPAASIRFVIIIDAFVEAVNAADRVYFYGHGTVFRV
jgi:hypothetical protein